MVMVMEMEMEMARETGVKPGHAVVMAMAL